MTFPVPQTMVEAEFEQIWKQLEHEASHEADPDAARTEMETERGEYRAIAERRVRSVCFCPTSGSAMASRSAARR
jgi:trigger factor